jgi:AcrR family transcriptional regulator
MTAAKQRTGPSRGPGRPRDEEITLRVHAAALAEVAERGANDANLASIARRAGIAKSTAYLRWPNLLDLLAEAVVEVVDYGPAPDTGRFRDDLLALAELVVQVSMVPPVLELHLQFMAMGDRAPAAYRRFQERDLPLGVTRGRIVFERARQRGEIGEAVDPEVATSAFMGALLLHALISPAHAGPDDAARAAVVDLFVDGLAHQRG